MRLKQRVALITGAGTGIGARIAELFAQEGAKVYIGDIDQDQGNKQMESIRASLAQAFFLPLDVTKEEDWIRVYSQIMGIEERFDILVNNAGINIRSPIDEMTMKDFDRMLAVNVRGVFLGIKHALPILKQNGGGCIVNMSSVCGLVGHRYTNVAYTTTKGAVTLMTKGVATRYAKDNIRVNSIHPSTVETRLTAALFENPDTKRERLSEVPLGRLATPQDVAKAALFLASDEASFITGVSLPVDGGLTAY